MRHTKNFDVLPKFVEEGYAIYEDDGVTECKLHDGRLIRLTQRPDWSFIGIKPDAPQWAKDEYEKYMRRFIPDENGMIWKY